MSEKLIYNSTLYSVIKKGDCYLEISKNRELLNIPYSDLAVIAKTIDEKELVLYNDKLYWLYVFDRDNTVICIILLPADIKNEQEYKKQMIGMI